MTEETTLAVQTSPEPTQQGRQETAIPSGSLGNNFFGVEPKEEPPVETPPATPPAATPAATTQPEPPKAEPPSATSWVNDFGWENEEVAKTEIKKLKEQTPAEQKFENEQSKRNAGR